MIQTAQYRILIVDDEEGIRFILGRLLQNEGYQVDAVAGRFEAIACLQGARYDLAFVDIALAGDSGIDLLRDIRAISPTTLVVMFTGYPQVESAAAAVRLGAFDYITKPVRRESLLLITRHALSAKRMNDKLEIHRADIEAIFRSVSDSIIMIDNVGRLAHFNSTAKSFCGLSGDLIGRDLASLFLGCDGLCRTALLETLSSNTSRTLSRLECRSPEGRSRIVNFTANPVTDSNGAVNGAVAVIRDETHLLELENAIQKRSLFHGIVGVSEPMQKVYSLVEALADVPTTVLIYGESGTGKELVAAALHASGSRASGPYVKVNCSALSESLLESELFGHVRGAFTGAIADKVGRFQMANGGTLFLDEIADISPAVQMRLLRVLQEGEFERVGESTSRKVNVRIIAATNQDLATLVKQGTFREDLYYRLNVVRLTVPALRKRSGDFELLVAHFVAKFNKKLGREIQGVSEDVMQLFTCHPWPGNVRELEHAIEHASVLCRSDIIAVHDLPQDLIDAVREGFVLSTDSDTAQSTTKKKLSLAEALEMSGGNKTLAANLLGISRLTVYRQLKKNGVDGEAMVPA